MASVTHNRSVTPSLRAPAVFGLLLALLTAAAWFAVPMRAHAYPECQAEFSISPPSQRVRPGAKIVVTAVCQQDLVWRATFNGEIRTGRGKNFRAEFIAPDPSGRASSSARENARVSKVYPLEVVGHFADPSLGDAECRRVFDITVSERGQAAPPDNDDSVLPNTGGPQLALLGLALLLLVAGAASIRRARRTRTEG